LWNNLFLIREVKVGPLHKDDKIFVSLYKSMSQLMADNFHYSGYQSHENTFENGDSMAQSFDSGDYGMTKLEYLKGIDVFQGHDWLQKRDDLLSVYPYYHHLYNFIELFRKQ